MISPRPRAFRLVNVFTVPGDPLSGNPLCVFEDADGFSDSQMQALARQFNLSETTFVLSATQPGATARVRIFTPTSEMPFAGHPTLGTAHIVRSLRGSNSLTLEMKAGMVEVKGEGDRWTLRTARPPEIREPAASSQALAAMLGVPTVGKPLWVDTGTEQLVVPLAAESDVRSAKPNAEQMRTLAHSDRRGESSAYVWALRGHGEVVARFFYLQDGAVLEDPATGSACANLGGYLSATGQTSVALRVHQGDQVGRPSLLGLTVDADGSIRVSGEVVELGRGTIQLKVMASRQISET